jgi:lipoate-protein ligase A
MSGFIEPQPLHVVPNPGGNDDPLGESVLDPALPWLRVFEPRDTCVVIGRHQDVEREVAVEQAKADGIPVYRRVAGGGAVVLAPGMAVVAVRLAPRPLGSVDWFDTVNEALVPAVAAVAGVPVTVRGHGDLTILGDDGNPRKILGASLRQTSKMTVYLGVLMVADAVPLMEAYLHPPSRRPDYRGNRDHRAFCINLGQRGVTVPALAASLDEYCRRILGPAALV